MIGFILAYLLGLGFAVFLHYDDSEPGHNLMSTRLELWLEPVLKGLLWPVHLFVFVLRVWLEGFKAVLD